MKSYLVLGLGRFGRSLATELYNHGSEVLAIDKDEDIVNEIQTHVTHALIGDCADENVLQSIGVRNFDVVIVAVGGEDIQTSTLATIMLKELGANYVISRAADALHGKILKKIGADRVIMPEYDMGVRCAKSLTSSNILDMINLSEDYSIVEIKAPKSWVDSSIKTLNLRSNYGITVLAVKGENRFIITPSSDFMIKDEDILVILGHNKNIAKIKE